MVKGMRYDVDAPATDPNSRSVQLYSPAGSSITMRLFRWGRVRVVAEDRPWILSTLMLAVGYATPPTDHTMTLATIIPVSAGNAEVSFTIGSIEQLASNMTSDKSHSLR